jgi:hypothetical protein
MDRQCLLSPEVAGGRTQDTGDRSLEPVAVASLQETGDRRQETGDRRQETGDRRDRRKETG